MVRVKRAQAWSIDLVIGVLIFLLVAGLFYATILRNQGEDTTTIRISSETIATKLINDPNLRITEDNAISAERIKRLIEKDIDDLRREFGADTEFCVFFEDEKGNLVPIFIDEDDQTKVYHGIGSNSISVSDHPCNSPVDD